jgi:hypothetical protein
VRTATSIWFVVVSATAGLLGSTSSAMTRASGSSSCSNSSRLGAISKFVWVTPVTLPPRPVQAGDEAELDRIGGGSEHDRNGCGRRVCRQCRRSAGGGNDRDLTRNQIGRQRWQAVILAHRPSGIQS